MNVGIITIHNHYNYGAVLQAFALSRIVSRIGHRSQIIDCNIDPGIGRLIRWTRHPGALIRNLYLVCHIAANRRFTKRFLDFSRQHISLSDNTYETIGQLMAEPPQFDAYITGSDQVWRPSLLDQEIGDAFHLCFASPEKSRLISYAPSFGVSEMPEQYIKKISTYLMRYHALSVREKRGKEIIFEITGRNAEHVMDPTLLLSAEEYEQILISPSIADEYILVYPMELGKNMEFLHLVKEVKKRVSLPVICVLPLNFDFRWLMIADKVVLDAGPREFLGLFKKASIICTNSFHGTVFSIIYRKNFLCVPHSISNLRIYGLLENLDLLNRQITYSNKFRVKDCLEESINYSAVIPLLQNSIDRSIAYLKNALL